jgi:hypothetical protein
MLMTQNFVSTWQYVSAADITDTNATAAAAAPGAGRRHRVVAVQIANVDTTPGTFVHILSGSTVIWTGFVSPYVVAAPGASYIEATFPIPLVCATNEACNVKVETASQIRFNVQGFVERSGTLA